MPIRVLVQAGHISPREKGHEAGTGTVREQELTYALRKRLVSLLEADERFDAIPQPGDLTDVPCEAALFLHGDGSRDPRSSGFSFGTPGRDVHGTFTPWAVNWKLAMMIRDEFLKIPGHPPEHASNYTGGLRWYYGYSRISTSGPEVLVEHGFLTNPAEQKWIFTHLAELASAEYNALCRYFGIEPRAAIAPARLGWIVEWTDAQGVRRRKRTFTPRRLFLRLWTDGVRRRILVRREQPIPESR